MSKSRFKIHEDNRTEKSPTKAPKDVREQIAEKLGYKSFEEVMVQWDKIRKLIADGNKSSYPRDWFESLIWELYQQPLQVPCKCITPKGDDGSVCQACQGTGKVPRVE